MWGSHGSFGQQLTESTVFLYAGLEMSHHLGADLLLRVAFDVTPHGVFQHRLEVSALLASGDDCQ